MSAEPETTAHEGQVLGRYTLRRQLGRGGMATVYLAETAGPAGFGKWFAVKVIHPHLADDPVMVDMFRDEAAIACRIQHPNVCQVIDFGRSDEGQLYLAMEYLRGQPLGRVLTRALERGPVPLWLAARVVADAARGLHAAHELAAEDGQALDVVHRDVSPQNIVIMYDGPAKVLDFGVARMHGRIVTTRDGQTKGKLAYMSPEQVRGEVVDRRTDVWGLGVVLWEATTGHRLFQSASEGNLVLNVMNEPIPHPAARRKDCPSALDAVVMRALRREPAERFQTAGELADALEDWLHTSGERSGHAQVSEWLRELFAEEYARRNAPLSIHETEPTELHVGDSTLEAGLQTEIRPRPARPRPKSPVLQSIALVVTILAVVLSAAWIATYVSEPGASSPDAPTAPSGIAAARKAPNALAPTKAEPETQPAPTTAAPPLPSGEDGAQESEPTTTARRRRAARLAPGWVSLVSIPEAEVRWRGRRLGQTPLVRAQLPPGEHRLRLTPVGGGPSRVVSIRIRSGELTRRPLIRLR